MAYKSSIKILNIKAYYYTSISVKLVRIDFRYIKKEIEKLQLEQKPYFYK